MKLIEYPSPNHSPRPAGVRVDTIIIHHTATKANAVGNQSALSWLRNPESKASAHYVITTVGAIYRLVPEDRTAWHAGESYLPWEKQKTRAGVNGRSIGIELVNPGDGVTPFTEAQYVALGELLQDIVRRLKLRPVVYEHGVTEFSTEWTHVCWVLGHRDVAPGRKTDPADNFDWGRVRSMLTARVA